MTAAESLLWPGVVVAAGGIPGLCVPLLAAGLGMVGVAVALALLGVVRAVAGWRRHDVGTAVDELSAAVLDKELRDLLAKEQGRR